MTPNITILPIAHTKTDCTAWSALHIACLAGPTSDLIYGTSGISPETFDWIVQRRLTELTSPNSTFLKAVDSSGRMVGMTKWTLCKRNDVEVGGTKKQAVDQGTDEDRSADAAAMRLTSIAPTEDAPPDLGISKPVITAIMTPLRQACDEIMQPYPVYVKLNAVYVLPELQRHGIGGKLLDESVAAAEALGVPMYLDSLGEAKRLYERRGWVTVREVVFDRAEFGGEGREVYHCMVRQVDENAKGKKEG